LKLEARGAGHAGFADLVPPSVLFPENMLSGARLHWGGHTGDATRRASPCGGCWSAYTRCS